MLDTTDPLRVVIDGVEHWQYPDGRSLPIMAGGDGTEGDDGRAGDGRTTDDGAAATADADRTSDDGGTGDEKLGDRGKAALDKERQKARELEKQLKAEQKARKALEDEKLSETERLKKEAEEGQSKAATATDKLRKANLITALADHGITGANAKAAAKLLDAVEYDDEDEPTNLEDAIRAATEEYGPALFKGARRRAPATDGGAGGSGSGDGPSLTAEQQQMARAFGMSDEEYARHMKP